MSLSLALAVALTRQCAPQVAETTMLAVIKAESGLDPFAIGDNSTGRSYHPGDARTAIAIATALISAGHSIDMGLAQINSRTAPRLGLGVADAFDACPNLAAASRLMVANYRRLAPGSINVQHAIGRTLSSYNTGDSARGFRNGYVARVYRAAGGAPSPSWFALMPAAVRSNAITTTVSAPARVAPTWDVFADAATTTVVFDRPLEEGRRQ